MQMYLFVPSHPGYSSVDRRCDSCRFGTRLIIDDTANSAPLHFRVGYAIVSQVPCMFLAQNEPVPTCFCANLVQMCPAIY